MSVRKIAEGVYQIDYYPQGRKGKRVQARYYGTERSARQYEREVRQQRPVVNPTNPTIRAMMPRYEQWIAMFRAPSTVKDIKKSMTTLAAHFGPYPCSRLTPSLFMAYQHQRLDAGVKPRTVNKELDYLRGLLRWAVKEGYAQPLTFKVQRLKAIRPLPQIPTPQEVENFIAQIQKDRPTKEAIIRLLYDCGLRWSEATTLRGHQVHWPSKTVRIIGKGGRERLAHLTPRLVALLRPRRLTAPDAYLLPNPRTGTPYRDFRVLFRMAATRLSARRLHPHLLRHAWATHSLEAGADIRTIQAALGHRQITTTEWYTQVAPSRVRNATAQTATWRSNQLTTVVNKTRRKPAKHAVRTKKP